MTLIEALMLLWWANEGDALKHAYVECHKACLVDAVRTQLGLRDFEWLSVWCGRGSNTALRRAALEKALREVRP